MIDYRQVIARATFTKQDFLRKKEELDVKTAKAVAYADTASKANSIIANAASNARAQIKTILETLVSNALEEVFPEEEFSFNVAFDISYSKTSVKFELIQDGEVLDPIEACGGGVCDVISFMLRIACIYLSGSRRILIADEPFKFLSAEKRPLIYGCLSELAKTYALTVIMVSHDKLAIDYADNHYKVTKNKGTATAVLC